MSSQEAHSLLVKNKYVFPASGLGPRTPSLIPECCLSEKEPLLIALAEGKQMLEKDSVGNAISLMAQFVS